MSNIQNRISELETGLIKVTEDIKTCQEFKQYAFEHKMIQKYNQLSDKLITLVMISRNLEQEIKDLNDLLYKPLTWAEIKKFNLINK